MKKSSNALRLMTGIPELDNLTKGLSAGIHVISGFRKCCKSTFSINLIYRALNEGKNVCLLSLEMSKIDVLNILLSLHSFECNPEKAVTRDELLTLYEIETVMMKYFIHFYHYLVVLLSTLKKI
jgi:KaiC/GvpD/RAD55 family RecA-like ATPase